MGRVGGDGDPFRPVWVVALDESSRAPCDHGIGRKRTGDGGICADNTTMAQRDARQDRNAETEKAVVPNDDRALAVQRLLHDGSLRRIGSVDLVGQVNAVAKDTSVADLDALNGGQVNVSADVYIFPDGDGWMVGTTGVLLNGVKVGTAQERRACTHGDA